MVLFHRLKVKAVAKGTVLYSIFGYGTFCRWTTKTIQARNTKILGVNNTSGYKGVNFHKTKWRARITVDYKEIHLGTFDTALEAALVYDSYISQNNLEHTLNFPLRRQD